MKDIRAQLGAALKACRIHQRLTQEQLAERSGLSYKFIGEVERGLANPTIVTLARLADALGVGLSAFFSDTDSRRLPEEYQISKRELQRVREALESIADITSTVSNVPYPRPTRRRKLRSA